MMLRISMRPGRCAFALAAFLLPLTSSFAVPPSNQADVQLQTDLGHMVIHVGQAEPLPPGGCTAGYSWHTTFGGCRRVVPESETSSCPANYKGNQVRTRSAFVLQANSNDIAYGPWSAWQSSCVYSPPITCRYDVYKYMITEDVRKRSDTMYRFYTNGTNDATHVGLQPTWRGFYRGSRRRSDPYQDGGDSGNTIGYRHYYQICGPF